ncbi:hypothetical protein [Gynuella sunshinyii]|uniref:hypothetical protein n=1 Tax=Gynuella sunshinyii TaxID=1445505 RepID=UPI0005CBF136|nr:hypothetical protein [Gynuella sunshinyii]
MDKYTHLYVRGGSAKKAVIVSGGLDKAEEPQTALDISLLTTRSIDNIYMSFIEKPTTDNNGEVVVNFLQFCTKHSLEYNHLLIFCVK